MALEFYQEHEQYMMIDKACVFNITLASQTPRLIWINTLRWRHNGHDGVSDHQPPDCLPKRLFRRTSKKTPKLRVTGLCEGNSPVTGEFPIQMASNAENASIRWRHNVTVSGILSCLEYTAIWARAAGWTTAQPLGGLFLIAPTHATVFGVLS